jgi:hypothetical protein
MTKQDELDLKTSINNLFVQTGIATVKQGILQSMVLGVFKENLPNEQYKNIYTNYVNLLEEALIDVVNTIKPILFDIQDPAFLIRQRIDVHSVIASMKMKDDYIFDSDQ